MAAATALQLRGRLILAIGLTVLTAVVVLEVVGYRATKAAVRSAAMARLTNVADQIAQSSGPGTREWLRRLGSVAQDPSVIAALRAPRDAAGSVPAALVPLGPDSGVIVATVLLDRNGEVVGSLGGTPPPWPDLHADSAAVTRLFVVGDTVMYATSAPVKASGESLGHILQVRRVIGGTSLKAQVPLLVGPEGSLLLGNPDGSVWTDFEGIVARPPVQSGGAEYQRNGAVRLAAAARLTGMPFVFAVEMPKRAALAPATALLRSYIGIGVAAVVLGIIVAWVVGRTIAGPLVTLTEATGPVVDGAPLPAGLPVDRRDEIGSLARSFQAMADRVRAGRATLEATVAERTRELSVAVDQLREAQDTLVRKERLATLGQLAGSVGHELRNPLGVMTNAVYYLEASQREAPPKVREYLGIIRNQIRISEKIVADLLDFGRIRPPQRSEVDLPAFLDEQVARAGLPEAIKVEQDLGDVGLVAMDPVQIGQVIHNLLTNAAQAIDGAAGKVTVRAGRRNGHVWIEVADTGPGIPETDLARIFEPLFTTRARGIGLGLAVSQGLARANGGDLTARSEPGQGAKFILELPTSGPA